VFFLFVLFFISFHGYRHDDRRHRRERRTLYNFTDRVTRAVPSSLAVNIDRYDNHILYRNIYFSTAISYLYNIIYEYGHVQLRRASTLFSVLLLGFYDLGHYPFRFIY